MYTVLVIVRVRRGCTETEHARERGVEDQTSAVIALILHECDGRDMCASHRQIHAKLDTEHAIYIHSMDTHLTICSIDKCRDIIIII